MTDYPEDDLCENCGEKPVEFNCENCQGGFCEDCFGSNYCLAPDCKALEKPNL